MDFEIKGSQSPSPSPELLIFFFLFRFRICRGDKQPNTPKKSSTLVTPRRYGTSPRSPWFRPVPPIFISSFIYSRPKKAYRTGLRTRDTDALRSTGTS
ncbi:hypothetical protein Bca101_025386 [Brassica carinata]